MAIGELSRQKYAKVLTRWTNGKSIILIILLAMDSQYAIGCFTAAALRAKAKENAELISQVLLGEPLRVIDHGRVWSRVQCAEDGLKGTLEAIRSCWLTS